MPARSALPALTPPPPPCTLPMSVAPCSYQINLKGPGACPPAPPSTLTRPLHPMAPMPPPGTHGSWPHDPTWLPPPTPHGCFGIFLGAPAHGPRILRPPRSPHCGHSYEKRTGVATTSPAATVNLCPHFHRLSMRPSRTADATFALHFGHSDEKRAVADWAATTLPAATVNWCPHVRRLLMRPSRVVDSTFVPLMASGRV